VKELQKAGLRLLAIIKACLSSCHLHKQLLWGKQLVLFFALTSPCLAASTYPALRPPNYAICRVAGGGSGSSKMVVIIAQGGGGDASTRKSRQAVASSSGAAGLISPRQQTHREI
jgi:hypothetical protein